MRLGHYLAAGIAMGGLVAAGCAGSSLYSGPSAAGKTESTTSGGMERVQIAPDGKGFVTHPSGRRFVPWGNNYGNQGRLVEDFWEAEWETIEGDFCEMKELGANVVRVHLQYAKFMKSHDLPDEAALQRLDRLLALAEKTGLYLDLTGLACYRTSDVPAWYDALGEKERWAAQARFWEVIAERCANSNAVFFYDLINEPVVPDRPCEPGAWYSGMPFGGLDFVQRIVLDPAGRPSKEVAREWVAMLVQAIRRHDPDALISVGLLPASPSGTYGSGFDPKVLAPHLDFICVHIYPEKGKAEEALAILRSADVGKPVVIEETFPLSCSREELESFLLASRGMASGWIGHYDGITVEEYRTMQDSGTITIAQAIWLSWLETFVAKRAEMVGE